jgi:hypothetical protein
MRKIDKQPFPGIEGKNFFDERRFFLLTQKRQKSESFCNLDVSVFWGF